MSASSSRRKTTPSLLLAAAVLCWAPRIAAEPPRVPPWRFTFVPAENAPKNCPDERDVRLAVTARMGYDPFTDEAPRAISVRLVRSLQQVEAHIEARDESGRIVATPKAWVEAWRCDLLGDRAAIFLLDIVDPVVSVSPEEPAPTAPSPRPPPAPPSPASPSPPAQRVTKPAHLHDTRARSAWSPKLAVSLAAGPTWWTAPQTSISVTMGIAARWARLSLGAEGRFDYAWKLPMQAAVSGRVVGGATVACGHLGVGSSRVIVKGCFFGEVASLETSAEGVVVLDGEATIANIGARASGGFWFHRRFGIELQVDAIYAVHRPAIWLDQLNAFRVPLVTPAIRLGLIGLIDTP